MAAEKQLEQAGPKDMPAETRRRLSANRVLALCFFTTSLLVAIFVNRIQQSRDAIERRVSELGHQLVGSSGFVRTADYVITELNVGTEATDQDILQFQELKSLESLSLASSQISDEALDCLTEFKRLKKSRSVFDQHHR